jgi:uncharacterized integral membrane protein (TIGR00698 family)
VRKEVVATQASESQARVWTRKAIFLAGLTVAGTGIVSPPIALVLGIVFALLVEHPLRALASKLAKLLLQISVVMLGFGMHLQQVVRAGRSGFLYTAVGIATALGLGTLLGRLLKVEGKVSFLISAGTAVCGGSAIAALAPITEASEEEISVSMGTVFLLNSVGLLLFPVIGYALHLSQNQFGLWAALAIHDTSSVVGATAKYGEQALAIGTTVKLARALWILPLSLMVAAFMTRRRSAAGVEGRPVKVKAPWFILWFCVAAAVSTYLPKLHGTWSFLTVLGRVGLTATLFLIGTGLSIKTLRKVGVKPLVQGVALWVIVASASLAAIYFGVISI